MKTTLENLLAVIFFIVGVIATVVALKGAEWHFCTAFLCFLIFFTIRDNSEKKETRTDI